MKFSQLKYERPDFETLTAKLDDCISDFSKSDNFDAQFQVFQDFCTIFDDFTTFLALARIRYYMDTSDAFYKNETLVLSQVAPTLTDKASDFYKLILKSPFKQSFSDKISPVFIKNIEFTCKSFSAEIVEDIKEENALVHEYMQHVSKLSVEFDGKTMPISALAPYKESLNREIRRKAHIAEGECYNSVKDNFDEIFDKLVKVRTKQAKKLGYDNYVELGYAKMRRICFDSSDITNLKNQVLEEIVPLNTEIRNKRRKRLEIDSLKFYDLPLSFKEGSPKPKIFGEDLVSAGKEMYSKMHESTNTFFDFLINSELIDVHPRQNKAPIGFCSFLPNYDAPFIFANFNNTSYDVNVLIHEAGHAFARYINSKKPFEQQLSSYSQTIAEIHSMSMEFLATPYYELFFKEDSKKFELSHLEDAFLFIPYACQVDEFQQKIYENPDMTPKERDELWLEIDKKFRPDIDYDGLPFYSEGSAWSRQTHIFKSPFYYIDYCLAEIVALEFYALFRESKSEAFNKYLTLVNFGGNKSYVDLLKEIGFDSPFKNLTIRNIINKIDVYNMLII